MTTSGPEPGAQRWGPEGPTAKEAHPQNGARPPGPTVRPHSTGVRVLAQRYHLIAPIGRGTAGVVWEGYDLVTHRKVALKEIKLPPDMPERDRQIARERAQREASAIAALAHPNVVAFYDLLDVGGNPWVVMELLQARSLADLIREQGPLPPERVATIGLAVLAGLEAAHDAGITHRDVKPGNIMLTEGGRVKLTDFGIARVDGASTITETGTLVGSPSYIPPEVVQGATPGPAVDMWGLGASLYAALEARAPFDAGEPMATLQAVVSQPTPIARNAGLLAQVIAGLLTKDPRRRLGPIQARHLLLDAARRYDRSAAPDEQRFAPEPMDPDATVIMSRVVNGGEPPMPDRLPPADLGSEDTAVLPVPGLMDAPGPEPMPDPRAERPRTGGGGRTVAALAAALVLVAAIGYGCYWVIGKTTGDDKQTTATTSGRHTAKQPPAAQPQSTTHPNSHGVTSNAAFVPYTDAGGFTVQLPKGWTRQPRSNGVTDFDDPRSDRFVRLIDGVTPPGNLVTSFENGERDFQAAHPGYHRVALHAVEFRGYPAADWEFTYTAENGTTRHVRYRQFTVGGTTYGVYISAPESQFAATVPMFDRAAASFTVH